MAEWTDQGTRPGLAIAGLHVHYSDDEAWIALEGRLGFRSDALGRAVGLGAHTTVRVELEALE